MYCWNFGLCNVFWILVVWIVVGLLLCVKCFWCMWLVLVFGLIVVLIIIFNDIIWIYFVWMFVNLWKCFFIELDMFVESVNIWVMVGGCKEVDKLF